MGPRSSLVCALLCARSSACASALPVPVPVSLALSLALPQVSLRRSQTHSSTKTNSAPTSAHSYRFNHFRPLAAPKFLSPAAPLSLRCRLGSAVRAERATTLVSFRRRLRSFRSGAARAPRKLAGRARNMMKTEPFICHSWKTNHFCRPTARGQLAPAEARRSSRANRHSPKGQTAPPSSPKARQKLAQSLPKAAQKLARLARARQTAGRGSGPAKSGQLCLARARQRVQLAGPSARLAQLAGKLASKLASKPRLLASNMELH